MGFGSPLPRSFKHPDHGKRPCELFYGLLMAYLGLYTPGHEKRRYGLFWGLSWGALRLLKNLFWACPGFGVIPAPQSVVVFGAVRRVFAGRAWLSRGVHPVRKVYDPQGVKIKRDFLVVLTSGKRQRAIGVDQESILCAQSLANRLMDRINFSRQYPGIG